jgi:hypothetical protein
MVYDCFTHINLRSMDNPGYGGFFGPMEIVNQPISWEIYNWLCLEVILLVVNILLIMVNTWLLNG